MEAQEGIITFIIIGCLAMFSLAIVIILFIVMYQRNMLLKETKIKLLENERQLDELKAQFITTASHEFLTPLTTILTSTELIEMYVNKSEPDKQLRHINRIRTSVQSLKSIYSDFLSHEKINLGKIENKPELINIKDCIDQIITTCFNNYPHHHFINKHEGTETEVLLDKSIFNTVITNLVSNACKYSKENSKVTINTNQHSNGILISVKDEGIGIPKKDQTFLFDSFYRASNVNQIKGTGIGLNITKKLTEIARWKLTFNSEENIGTTFFIKIPL